MTAANRYGWLREVNGQQLQAAACLAGGATHEDAAQVAGVHRVTVSRWANHHPAFIAEVNRLRIEAAEQAVATVRRITSAALAVVESAVEAGDLEAALKWLRLGTLRSLTAVAGGATDPVAVIEGVRRSMPTALATLLSDPNDPSTADAEALIVARLGSSNE